MVNAIALILSLASIAASLAVLAKLRVLEARLEALQSPQPHPRVPIEDANVLEGLTVAVNVQQDYSTPVLQRLIVEELEKRDARVVGLAQPADLVIEGSVVCNGYADVYYQADLTVRSGGTDLFVVHESRVSGDRPINLALEVLAALKQELFDRNKRLERRTALDELSDIGH